MNRTETPAHEDTAVHEGRDDPATDGTIEPLHDAALDAQAPSWLAANRTQIFTGMALVALLVFGVLTVLVTDGLTTGVDLVVTLAVQRLTFPLVGPLMVGVSWIGFPPQSFVLVVVVVALFWLAGYRAEAGFAIAAAASDILTETIKIVVSRPRPGADLVHVIAGASGQSFPSGHTLFYVTFFGFLAYVAYARLKQGWLRTGLLWLFGLLIVLVGPSRIWMGQHWASDVLASYALGCAYVVVLVQVYSRFRYHRTIVSEASEGSRHSLR
jgi:undecaprenyl-diphosphatase